MKNLVPLQLLEIDKCFNWVCENLRIDNVSHQKIIFGSTMDNWQRGRMKIVIVGDPPNANYERAYFRDTGND